MKITIYDVAEKAGVSIATVSKVINNTGRISEKTRKKVIKITTLHKHTLDHNSGRTFFGVRVAGFHTRLALLSRKKLCVRKVR